MIFQTKNVGIACTVPLADKEIRFEIRASIVEWHRVMLELPATSDEKLPQGGQGEAD
jgi:hypothetical protein